MKSILAAAMLLLATPVLADCVSCGPTQITSRFVNDLAQVNPLLAGAAWAGIAEANSTRKDRAEVKGTMGRDGKSYTYRAEVRRLSQDSVSMIIEVQEDGAPGVRRYEGALANEGRSGRFLEVGAKGRSPVYSWDAAKPR